MAFVVPAEIGHATYAVPLLEYFAGNFSVVLVIAIQDRVFSGLSEDCWLLYADGFGGSTDHIRLTQRQSFCYDPQVPQDFERVSLTDWRHWRSRLRPFLLPGAIRSFYRELADGPTTVRLGDVARVGIGYVTGANSFFHLRPSEAERAGIPQRFLHPSVRNGGTLPRAAVTHATVRAWLNQDKPVLLLRIGDGQTLPSAVVRHLQTSEATQAKQAYKCRMRDPWYVVPDVHVPDAFLAYMSGHEVAFVANSAKCVCTNSVHTVRLNNGVSVEALRRGWSSSLARLSCEVEGHPLGGGLLKLEPREAANLVLPNVRKAELRPLRLLDEGTEIMRQWRHYGQRT
ncbi:MAG: hypothetical protein JW993_13475 [Sedimentisphaerales bacterium]|nr:hypothetical protein [Sedimentisphaerales bacterium]